MPGASSKLVKLGARKSCVMLRWKRRPASARATVRLRGHDAFGHAVTARRTASLR
jgi:hypothetical protein